LIAQMINESDKEETKDMLNNRVIRIENGERDLYV